MNVVWKEEYTTLTRKRSLVMLIVLSILTFGIYGIYFMYKYIKDINMVCEGDRQESPSIVKYIIFHIITLSIYSYFWIYKQQNRMKYYGEANNLNTKESGATLVLIVIVGYIIGNISTFVFGFATLMPDFSTLSSGSYTPAVSGTQIAASTIGSFIAVAGSLYVWHVLIKNLNTLVENVFKSKPNA